MREKTLQQSVACLPGGVANQQSKIEINKEETTIVGSEEVLKTLLLLKLSGTVPVTYSRNFKRAQPRHARITKQHFTQFHSLVELQCGIPK